MEKLSQYDGDDIFPEIKETDVPMRFVGDGCAISRLPADIMPNPGKRKRACRWESLPENDQSVSSPGKHRRRDYRPYAGACEMYGGELFACSVVRTMMTIES